MPLAIAAGLARLTALAHLFALAGAITGLLSRAFAALPGECVIVQFALFAKQVRKRLKGIGHLLLPLGQLALLARFTTFLAGHGEPVAAAGAALLEFQILEHVGDVRQKLAGLIRCAGFSQVFQRVQHLLKLVCAKALSPTLWTHIGHVRRLGAIDHGLSHLRSDVVIGRLAKGLHQATYLIFGGAIAQSLLQGPPRGQQRAQRVGRASIFGLERHLPKQIVHTVGLGLVGRGQQDPVRHAQAEIDRPVFEIAPRLQRQSVQQFSGHPDVRRRRFKPARRVNIQRARLKRGQVGWQFAIATRLAQDRDADFLGGLGKGLQQ